MARDALAYPAPRYPERPQPPAGVEELMPFARRAVERTSGLGPLGLVKPGEKALIIIPPDQDGLTLNAIINAFREKGIEAAPLPQETVAGIAREKLSRQSLLEGWVEVYWRDETAALLGLEPRGLIQFVGTRVPEQFFDAHAEYDRYDRIFLGDGGPRFYRQSIGKHAHRLVGSWIYDSAESLQGKVDLVPKEVVSAMEAKIIGLLSRISEVRITDPQGSDLRFSLTPEESKLWGAWSLPGHIYFYPLQAFMAINYDPHLAPIKERLRAEGVDLRMKFAKAEGVIAGTGNHTGYFPHMRTYLKEGQVYRIEGGGKFGDLLREFMDRTKNVRYPGYPRPGNLYLLEIALGTNPKFFRRQREMREGSFELLTNVYERQRSGVLHWGIGLDDYDPEFVKYAIENGLPKNHIGHAAHTYFSTIEVTLRDTGERLKVVDRGHLAALDDPEIRKIAERFGDPDELLKEEWIPAIPGINYPGDYMRDYGSNPGEWVKREVEEELPPTAGVPG